MSIRRFMDRMMFKAGIICSIPAFVWRWPRTHKWICRPNACRHSQGCGQTLRRCRSPPKGTPAPAAMVTKQERQAYAKLEAEDHADPAKLSFDIDAFVAKYPDSAYAAPLYSELAQSYFSAGQIDQMQARREQSSQTGSE